MRYTNDASARLTYLDLLRVLAAFSVIVLHVSAASLFSVEVDSFEWRVMNGFDSLSRWAVPVFVMISGALFLGREIELKKMYGKYILRLMIAFLAWSLVYNLYIYHSVHLMPIIKGFGHLWYLYMIIGLYMITPLLNLMIRDRKMTTYFLVLAGIFNILLPQIGKVINLWSPAHAEWLNDLLDQADLRFVMGYSMYYVLGYVLRHTEFSRQKRYMIYALGLAGFLMTMGLTSYVSNRQQEMNDLFYDYFTLNVALEGVSAFVFIKYLVNRISFGERAAKVLGILSKYSFGVYLVHFLVLTEFKRISGIGTLSFSPLLSIPLLSIIVCVISVVISALLNQIPILKKYLV